jgi:two-component system, chemotaxis family, sensor kinase CheA
VLKAVDELRAMVSVSTTPTGSKELTRSQQALKKEIAREVEARSTKVMRPKGAAGESSASAKQDALPSTGPRTLRADVDKLDHMLNLTGEIVIAEGRLRQMIEKLGTARPPRNASRSRALVHGPAE